LKKKTQTENTLYGVSIINLPSGDTHGRLPCWKKVTCEIEEYIKDTLSSELMHLRSMEIFNKNKNVNHVTVLTWLGSKPKYLWVSKNLQVASSVKGLVIIYH
jgi:hypothetical protein